MVLCFGVVRPYKGVDVLVEAFREVEGAELWVVGRPLGRLDGAAASAAPRGRVRFVPRYVSDAELPAYFRRADLLVLPHRSVDVSGVLFAGLAFGKPMVLSDVGGFRELVEDHGAGRLVPPGDPQALAAAIGELLADPAERERLGGAPRRRPPGPTRGTRIAQRTLAVYEEVLRVRVVFMGKASARPCGRSTGWWRGRARWPRWWPGARPVDAREQRLDLVGRAPRAAARRRGRALRRPAGGRRPGVSFLFWNRIREPLISLGRSAASTSTRRRCPTSAGSGGYNVAILEGLREWGVSCHFVDEGFDTGDLVEVERFPIDPGAETALLARPREPGAAAGLFERVMRALRWRARSCRARPRGRGAT